MARREDIDTAIWDDPDFRRLSADAKFVYIWTFTNGCGMAGVYKLDKARVTFDTGIPPARADKALEELCEGSYLVMADPWVWVRTRVKRLRARTKQMAWSVCADLEHLSESHPIRAGFVGEYLTYSWLADQGGERWRRLCDETVFTGLGLEPNTVNLNPTSPEVHPNLKGNGNGVVSTSELTETTKDGQLRDEFVEWLEHHEQTTEMRPPRQGTQIRKDIAAMFGARRSEGYELEDLKRATVGAFNDEHRREHGYYGHESVLRPTKVHDLIEKGRRSKPKPARERHARVHIEGDEHTCRRCPEPITNLQANNQSGMCDECYEAHIEKLTGPTEAA